MNFKKVNPHVFAKTGLIQTPDTIYWKKYGVPVLVKEFGAIDYIDFSPVEPHYFAVTCSVRVQIYNPITKLVAKNLSRFQENAYGGTFRKDGRLLVAGDEEKYVKLFDVSTRNILRSFKGHTGPVHRTFFTSDMIHIASFSDDKTIKLWDIPTEKSVHTYRGHKDYIRAGCVSPVSSNIVLSGGYDNIINMYDTRTHSNVFTVNHGSPVESIIFLPTGGIFISAGGTEIKVWDALMGGKLLANISQHHKTVTCLKLASNGKRLLSGSLDRHVKIYDISTYQVVHNIDYPNAVLSLGVSSNDSTIVAGMVDGLFSIQNREEEDDRIVKKRVQTTAKLNDENFDEVVPEYLANGESNHDKCLRKFEYANALNCVMKAYIVNKNPHITVALIQELMRRKGLERAIVGRDHKFIAAFVRFIMRYLSEARFTKILLDATEIFLNVYEDSLGEFSTELAKQVLDLANRLKTEEELTMECLNLQGAFELITAGASVADTRSNSTKNSSTLEPSTSAGRHAIINVE